MNPVTLSPAERLTADIVDIKRWIREMKLDPSGGGAGAVTSVFGRTGAVVAATNDYTWAQVNKAASSLADLTTRSAADLSSGTLPDARLSSNVALLAAAQALTNKDLTGAGNTFPTLNQDTTGKAAKADALNSATTAVNVSAATAPSLGQVLTATDSTHATWQTPSAGAGDMLKATYDPANIAQQLVGTTAAQTLSSKTLSTPTINGATLGYLLKTANFTVTSAAVTYAVDASGAARTATMISPTGIAGRFYMFKKTDSSANTVTINPAAAETFDGAASIVLDKQYQSVMLMSDGTNWIILRPRTAAGTGITVTNSGGVNTVAIDSTVATLTGTQALTNKDLTGVGNTFPTFNQNTTGSAAKLTTARAIYGNNFDGTADLAQIIASTYGGTGNGFTKFSGPATAEKTFTLPNASATILTSADTTGTGTTAVLSGSPTIVTPTIASLTNAQHNHQNAAGGGTLDAAAVASGILGTARLGSGSASSANFLRGDGAWATPAGAGDVSSDTATSVDAEIALFKSTTGKLIKRATGTGLALLTSGVLSTDTYTAATTYTPTLTGSGSNPALGNGTLTGHYLKVGKLVFFSINFTAGSTTTFGSGTWSFALPVAAAAVPGRYPMGAAEILDSGIAAYNAQAVAYSTTKVDLAVWNTTGTYGVSNQAGTTVPFTFGNLDQINLSGVYEAAA